MKSAASSTLVMSVLFHIALRDLTGQFIDVFSLDFIF